jgi:hypothetical protein
MICPFLPAPQVVTLRFYDRSIYSHGHGEVAARTLDENVRVVPEEERAGHVRRAGAEPTLCCYREMECG